MKYKAAMVTAVLCVALTGCKPAVEIGSLERYAGKYSATSQHVFDTNHSRVKAHGISIDREGDDYFLTLWHDTVDGEVTSAGEKLVIKRDPKTDEALYYVNQSQLVRVELARKGPIFTILTARLTQELQYSHYYAFRRWRTVEFDPASLELADINEILRKTDLKEDVLGHRIRWEGTITEVVQQTQEDARHLYAIHLAPRNGVVVVLTDIFSEHSTYIEGLLPSFAPVTIGREVAYKGIVVDVERDQDEGYVTLEVESVYYEVVEARVDNHPVADLVE